MVVAVAGRFRPALLIEIGGELGRQGAFASWGVAYCYGNRVEVLRGQVDSQKTDFSSLAGVKTDMAFFCMNRDKAVQPWVRREQDKDWAFACEGQVPDVPEEHLGFAPLCREERLFAHLARHFSADDPLGSVEKHRPAGSESLRFFLMSEEVLVVSTGENLSAGRLWLGRAPLFRVISPRKLETVRKLQWEELPEKGLVVFSRYRYALV